MIDLCLKWKFGQPGSKYSSWWQFTKSKEKIRIFKETGDLWYICQDELDKASFQHDMAYEYFKNLLRGTASDKMLCDKVFNFAKYSKCD